MHVDKSTLLFKDLNEYDIIALKEIDQVMSTGEIPWKNSFVQTWFADAFGIEKERLLVASTRVVLCMKSSILHIRVLQSITNWMFKNNSNTHSLKGTYNAC